MTVSDKQLERTREPGHLETRRTPLTDPNARIGSFLYEMAQQHDNRVWGLSGLVGMGSGLFLAMELPDPFGIWAALLGVVMLFVGITLDGLATSKVCPACDLCQDEDSNYCPSCGHTFSPVFAEPVTVVVDPDPASRPVRLAPQGDTGGDDATTRTGGENEW